MEPRLTSVGQRRTFVQAAVEAVFRYQTRFVITFTAVLTVVIFYILLAPKHYRSEMTILVHNARQNAQGAPGQPTASSAQPDATDNTLNAAMDTLRSRDIADQVLGTASSSAHHEKALERFYNNLHLDRSDQSRTIHATYDAHDASLAKQTLDKLLAAYLAKQREVQPPGQASNLWIKEQERYKRDLDEAQQHLVAYQQTHHIVSLPAREAVLEQQIADLQQQVRTTDVEITDYSERLAAGQKQLSHLSQRQLTQQKTVPNILAMEQLSTMLATYRNQKTSLLTKFPPTDRLVQEVDQQIVNTTEALHAAAEIQQSEKSTDVNPLWQQVQSALSQNTIDRSAAQARRRSRMAQAAHLQSALTRTQGYTVVLTTLQNKVTDLDRNYQLYTRKRDEAQAEYATGAQPLASITVAKQPTYPASPSNSLLDLYCLLGILAALFSAAACVFFSELQRDTIEYPWELSAVTKVPLLATMPFIQAAYLKFNTREIPDQDTSLPGKSGRTDAYGESPAQPWKVATSSKIRGDLFTRLAALSSAKINSASNDPPSFSIPTGLSP